MYKFIILVFLSASAYGQELVNPTYNFSITGKVKKEFVINMDSLNQYPLQEFVNPKITNYTLDYLHAKSVRGVLLKTILSHIVYDLNNSKQMRDVSFVFVGSNGMVSFSWNELFDSEIGSHLFIIMEIDGIRAVQKTDNIEISSMLGYKSGRRSLINLSKIMVVQQNQK